MLTILRTAEMSSRADYPVFLGRKTLAAVQRSKANRNVGFPLGPVQSWNEIA